MCGMDSRKQQAMSGLYTVRIGPTFNNTWLKNVLFDEFRAEP